MKKKKKTKMMIVCWRVPVEEKLTKKRMAWWSRMKRTRIVALAVDSRIATSEGFVLRVTPATKRKSRRKAEQRMMRRRKFEIWRRAATEEFVVQERPTTKTNLV